MDSRNENYFVWLFNQLKGWPIQNYMLWFFAFGFQLALLIQGKFDMVTLVTFIGTLLGTLCVLAINATKAINGWLGLISGLHVLSMLVLKQRIICQFLNKLLILLHLTCQLFFQLNHGMMILKIT